MRSLRSGILVGVSLCAVLLVATGPAVAAVADVTQPGDLIWGVHNTVAGGASTISGPLAPGDQSPGYPLNEMPDNAIDHTLDKYLNFGQNNDGVNTGLIVTPSMGQTLVTGLRFQAANDSPNRDPFTFTLEGTNDSDPTLPGTGWALIASGQTGFQTDPGRDIWQIAGSEPSFANSSIYTSYRLLFPTMRGTGQNSMQVAEVEFLGIPEPGTLGLLALGALAALRRRRAR
jgi:hypothetical protein